MKPIEISFAGAGVQASASQLKVLRQHFLEKDWVRLPGLLDATLLGRIMDLIHDESFFEVMHEDMSSDKEMRLDDCAVERALELLLNNERLFRLIENVTQCGHIGSFLGRTYRFEPGNEHEYRWHTDVADSRLVGLSLNLSVERYEGGNLHIRQCGAAESVQTVENNVLGDAVIFRISEDREHRVEAVTGYSPKTAYAGWFCAYPEFSERLLAL